MRQRSGTWEETVCVWGCDEKAGGQGPWEGSGTKSTSNKCYDEAAIGHLPWEKVGAAPALGEGGGQQATECSMTMSHHSLSS